MNSWKRWLGFDSGPPAEPTEKSAEETAVEAHRAGPDPTARENFEQPKNSVNNDPSTDSPALPLEATTPPKTTFHLALISHTNVGKTTLARTLLRRDVGEVLDRAHVTDESTAYTLAETETARLELWDTPGFGDSVRLRQRLEGRSQPLGWLLSQVWDRIADRPLWSSQQAVETLSQRADAVLYLANAAEDPELAGYVEPELAVLQWAGRPVLLLLNQLGDGPATPSAAALTDLDEASGNSASSGAASGTNSGANSGNADWIAPWRRMAQRFDVVRSVQPLDAFTRCWVQEGLLLRRLAHIVDESQRPLVAELAGAYQERQRQVYRRSAEQLGAYLGDAARGRQALTKARASRVEKQRAMERLLQKLEDRTQQLMDQMLELHELEGRAAVSFRHQLDDFLVSGTTALTTEQGALWGGAVSGAVGGLAADLLAGGLTFGGGMLAGALLGALGGAGLTRAYEIAKLRGEPAVAFSPLFLDQLARLTLLRYLAIAHFGRGRGPFEDAEPAQVWRQRVDDVYEDFSSEFKAAWKRAHDLDTGADSIGWLDRRLAAICKNCLDDLLLQAYPDAEELLR